MSALPPLHAWSADVSYALRWRVRGLHPGAHRGMGGGRSGVFRGLAPFDRCPDVRRLDLRHSLRDPFGQWQVREYEPRTAATVYALVDISASMAGGPAAGQMPLAARLCELLARSARRNGDAFGLYACGSEIHGEFSFPARRAGIHAAEIASRLAAVAPAGQGASGLGKAAGPLAGLRKLVFLISDFLFPPQEAAAILTALSAHDVVPIVLDSDALADLPDWGLAQLYDLESGQQRLMLLRPSVRKRWMAHAAARAARLDQLCAEHACRPFRPGRQLDIDAFGQYLLER
ncbi:DUF58 domain-containing protein [Pollutimonas bauzanensis]|uniref:DUF58 domain-containing protein n=1 Tax=Pollutimonas bauzanensis TaxID=658167 RepID=A0A1M5M898_9BURK|nr:DUF58 domain-containing protein [Pollutimonas bauzanensis]SHG73199.1 Protein of unknown function DUF58 [Pollutimonas bauzanensis]